MEGVVTDGTGKKWRGGRVTVSAVRPARARSWDSSDPAARIASYVAVAPINDPQIAVLVCLDEPHSWTTSGGALSGPVCAQVLAQVLPYLGIEPDYTAEEQEKLFAAVPDVTGWRTDAARQKLAEYGFEAAFVGGNERVESQYPAAGVTARKGFGDHAGHDRRLRCGGRRRLRHGVFNKNFTDIYCLFLFSWYTKHVLKQTI